MGQDVADRLSGDIFSREKLRILFVEPFIFPRVCGIDERTPMAESTRINRCVSAVPHSLCGKPIQGPPPLSMLAAAAFRPVIEIFWPNCGCAASAASLHGWTCSHASLTRGVVCLRGTKDGNSRH